MSDTHDSPDMPEPAQEEHAQTQSSNEARLTLLAEIGQQLRQAREQRGLGTDEIARELKLRASYLTAMENGDWSTLPGDVYGIGFARQYARYLGVDLEQDIARISSDEYQLTKPLTFPDPPIAPAKRWAITATLLFILLFIAFNVFHSVVHKPTTGPASLHPASPPPVAAPVSKPKTATPASAPAKAAPVPSVPAKTSPAQPAASPTEAAPAPATPTADTGTAPATEDKRKGAHRYRFVAVGGDVWLQLYSSPNTLVKEALLRQGQHMDVDSDATSLLMDCGNAGAIQISIDGKSVVSAGQLGPIGKVIRDYTLKVPTP